MRGFLKIGELARRTGVSVRALHHYDELGLLRPALGGKGEARLYGRAELERLLRIRSMQGLGFSLEEVRACLDDPGIAPLELVERHLAELEDRLALARRLRERLQGVARALRSASEPDAEDLLRAIELMNDMERFREYYTEEQLAALARRREEVGEERMLSVQRDWQELFEAFRRARERGDDPGSEAVRALARRHAELIAEFTGGDEGIRSSLARLHRENPDLSASWGVEPELRAYMGRACAALEDGR